MTETENLVLEHLKRFQHDLARMREDYTSMRSEITAIKHHIAGFLAHEVTQDSELSGLKARVERIERRLDLVE